MTRGHGWSLAFTMWRTCTSYFLAGFYRRFQDVPLGLQGRRAFVVYLP